MQKLKGLYTALITPFDENNRFDLPGFRTLIRRQIENKVDGIVVLGTTAETPTLSETEKHHIMINAQEEAAGKATFIVGTGSNSTATTIENTKLAEQLGADYALVITPYYNKPTQEGVYRHFKAVAESVKIPIIIYNHPGRTGTAITIETFLRLAEIPNICAIKETSGNVSFMSELIEKLPQLSVLSGDDPLTYPLMTLGGTGVISVAANLIPAEMKALVTACEEGQYDLAKQLHYQMAPLLRALFIESNPIPMKAAMEMSGLPSGGVRLPLCEMSPKNKEILQTTLNNLLYVKT